MPPLRARLGAAFATRLSPEHTRRATLFERLTVSRLSWDTLVRIYRHLELVGKLATGIWVGFITSVVLGVDWKPVVEGVFNTGTPIAEALLLAILLPTLLSSRPARSSGSPAGASSASCGGATSSESPRRGEARPPRPVGDWIQSSIRRREGAGLMSAANRGGSYTTPSRGLAGIVAFAGIMLALIGFFDILQGLTALFNDEYFAVRGGDLLVLDFTAWGWITLIWGVVLVAAGLGLLGGRGGARVFAIVVVFVNMILQIAFLAAYPIWSAIIIALDVFVLYALTARWDEVKLALKE
ncbi:MAG: DUF7144 family membrane protein [Solirubrobacteraceae bacterium]